jgi:hypothetical protein
MPYSSLPLVRSSTPAASAATRTDISSSSNAPLETLNVPSLLWSGTMYVGLSGTPRQRSALSSGSPLSIQSLRSSIRRAIPTRQRRLANVESTARSGLGSCSTAISCSERSVRSSYQTSTGAPSPGIVHSMFMFRTCHSIWMPPRDIGTIEGRGHPSRAASCSSSTAVAAASARISRAA